MSRQVSCTVTVCGGSEKHNHDLHYRAALDHVNTAEHPDAVIEILPYRPYKEQINEMLKPYIDEYNRHQQERYQSAWDRYNAGLIKTKPRKRDYKPMNYDYYTEHLDDRVWNPHVKKLEPAPMWREVILGLGDQEDKEAGLITREEAVATMKGVVERWPELFPDFKLLGATIHLDEEGFYHCHIDYKPLYEKDEPDRGLNVGVGHETALEHMGFTPEQSIINARDKAPIRFNAFRNKLYIATEEQLYKHGLRLWYNVSRVKEPYKDPSVNQRLEDWKDTQDGVLQMQRLKNNMLDIVEGDRVSPEGYKQALVAAEDVEKILKKVEEQPRSRVNKDNVVIHFSLFDQLRSIVKAFMNVIGHLLHKIDVLTENLDRAYEEIDMLRNRKMSLSDWMQSAEDRNTLPGAHEGFEKEKEK